MHIRKPEDYLATPAFLALLDRYPLADLFLDYDDDRVTVYGPGDEVVVCPAL